MSARRAAAAPPRFSSTWLAGQLRPLTGTLRGSSLCVAFSGGADSTALLAAAAGLRARWGCRLRALHVNHHLQPAAGAWARAAVRVARGLAVPCRVLQAPVVVARGASPEAAARRARYDALLGALRPGEWLLLAQHRDDQLETVLLQLLRGAGVAGLAAMPAAAGPLLRPLLGLERAALRDYLRRQRLAWSEDPSNADERYDRNYLRRQIVPGLLARWPSAGLTIGRSAALAAEAQQLLAAQADRQLQAAMDGDALQVAVLRRLGAAERRNALRRWLARRGLDLPDQRRLQEIAGPLLRARHDAQPSVQWPGGLVRRHGALLHAQQPAAGAAPDAAQALVWPWRQQPRLALADGGWLELAADPHGGLLLSALPERITVHGRGTQPATQPGARRTLKRRLQALGLPPWQRQSVPLLYEDGRLLAIADRWCAPPLRARAAAGGARARLRWHLPI